MEIWEAGRWDGKPAEEGGENKGAEKVEGTWDESIKNKLGAFCDVMDTSERETGRILTLGFEVTLSVWMGQGYDWSLVCSAGMGLSFGSHGRDVQRLRESLRLTRTCARVESGRVGQRLKNQRLSKVLSRSKINNYGIKKKKQSKV